MFPLFRSFLPLQNPIGFGATDFIVLEVAALLILLLLAYAALGRHVRALSARPAWSMLLLALLPVALRMAMLAQSPVPVGTGSDDFAHLLVAGTLHHLRLANPTHPMHRFFEAIFVLQEPSYSSIFPVGQGLVLAIGRTIFGHPWAGVVLSVAALCPLCYWMLRGWTTPGWAMVGGLLAVIQFGPLRYWMNTYWGGAVSAVAGCLVFGSLPRLRSRPRTRDAICLGAGIGIQMLTRPFECVLMVAAAILYFLPSLHRPVPWSTVMRTAAIAGLAILPALALSLLQNKQVTGSWTTMPYVLSRYQYGVPATFTFQPIPVPHRELAFAQQLDYRAQVAVHGEGPDSLKKFLDRLVERLPFYRYFLLPPLYLVLPFFLPSLREGRFRWVVATLLIFGLGTNFYPYFYPHYIAAATCLFLLVCVVGLERLSRLRSEAAALILLLCLVQFGFWYGFHLFAGTNASLAVLPYENWDFVNHGDPQGRLAIRDRLAQAAGRQLVFVRYWPQHRFDDWMQNEADIDGARVVWALDRGADNDNLRRFYPDRTAWLLEPDARPPKLSPYVVEPPAAPPAKVPPAQKEKPSPEQNGIQLLPVP